MLFFVVTAATLASIGPLACGEDTASPGTTGSRDASQDRRVVTVIPDASCEIVVDAPPELPRAPHLAAGVEASYNSNPPSSGLHDPVWAAYREFTTPVPRRNYVHDLEHGAIVFAYNCDKYATGDGAAACSEIVELLRTVVKSLPDDPLCTNEGKGVRVRALITPDPLLDVPIAAAAWGWTYRGGCLDRASLEDFARQHYGQGPEPVCGNGWDHF
ncbi:DUF3105 domain-containing protein [Pendulispora albinea]|uniref:DUF3105 domain-containing protein n=1 Tax=Pendulispora albinea TaxID=2741071 RepID=A0ABZ2M041_9BACT